MLRARHGFDLRTESATTTDGLRLAIQRFARPDSQPVVLMHGLAQNHRSWDLPLPGRSFAEFLARRGFDVWIPNLRSHGSGELRSEHSGRWDWTIDHFAARDVPAILDAVEGTTGRRPFWIGHSMGALAITMYLMGAELVETPGGQLRLVAEAAEAARRNERLQGFLALGMPARLEMETGRNLVYGLAAFVGDRTFVSRLLRRPGLGSRALRRMGRVPVRGLLDLLDFDPPGRRIANVNHLLRWALRRSAREATRLVTNRDIWHGPNMDRAVLEAALEHTVDDVCARVLLQFVDWADHRTFRADRAHAAPGEKPFVYGSHYDRITCPILLGGGVRDRLACIGTMEKVAFRGVGSHDRTFLPVADAGHVDILYGVNTSSTLYPILGSWMRNRIG